MLVGNFWSGSTLIFWPSTSAEIPANDEQAEVLEFLRRAGTLAPGETPREIDTHAAAVFLAGDHAWKLKRSVHFGYLDFSTIDKRQQALCDELRLNRRTAPDLYLAVFPITRDETGELAINGDGQAVDWLLQMRRFPDEALFSEMADRGSLGVEDVSKLADTIVAFHADAEIALCEDAEARFQSVIDGNAQSLSAFPAILAPEVALSLCDKQCAAVRALAPLLRDRGRAGRVRHGHGDLHLANIAKIADEPTLFDCLEFSTALATVDVLYDVAFLIMDLWHRGMRHEANVVLNRYLDRSPADESGVSLMPLFVSVRATVRAHVTAAQAVRPGSDPGLVDQAKSYLDLAVAAILPVAPRLVAIGGLSGTGKSSLARLLASEVGRLPGARILRSDVLRKELAGVSPETRLNASSYTPVAATKVYSALYSRASAALNSGQAVIADAAFTRLAERHAIKAVADDVRCRFEGIWLTASEDARKSRVGQRIADESDADADVVIAQTSIDLGDLGDWQLLSADKGLDLTIVSAREALGLKWPVHS